MIQSRRLAPCLCLTLGLSLSACAQWGGLQPSADIAPSPVAKAEPRATPPARQASRPAPQVKGLRPEPRPGGESETATLPAPAPPPPRLVGLSEQETVDLLGPPAEENPVPPGKVWLYRAEGCQLSVHLFPDMDKGGFYALDYTVDGARDECLGKVAGNARKRGGALVSDAGKAG